MNDLHSLFGLENKVAAVLGGGGVLAGAIAGGLANAGADVAILDLNKESAEKRVKSIKDIGRRSIAIELDATSKQQLVKAEEQIKTELGTTSILVNAPGINSTTPFFELSEEEWHKILDVNLKSIMLSCQIFARSMIDRGQEGSIINISSASSGPPLSKVFTYGISKAGINNLTQFLAREWAEQGIRVNALAPGFFPAEQNRKVLTPERVKHIMGHTPMNRFGDAEELVGASVWLASKNASSFVTGAIIRVDGGFTAMTI